MTEEEKKTIDFLKIFSKTEIDYCKLEKADVLDILNLINKQQKEIEELKDRNKELTETIEEWVNGERINDIKHISKDKIRNLLKQVNASLYHFKDSEKNNIVQRLKDKLEQLLEE